MALRLRRGLDIERQSITFAEGEPLYTTDTKQLYVGDGSTVGGNLVTGITSLLDDPTPQLGNNLDLNNHNITGVGNIDIVGDLTIKGGLTADFILADYRGSLFGTDSSLLVDGNKGVITASVVSGLITLVDVDTKAINLNYTSIDSLNDVIADSPMPGDTLIYQDGIWKSTRFGVDPITGLPPVEYSILQFSNSGGWVETTKISASDSTLIIDLESGEINLGSSSIRTFSDVWIDTVSLEPNEVLTWDGDFWTHKQIDVSHINLASVVFDNISDVNVPAPSLDDILKYDGTQWTNDSVSMSNLSDVWIDPTIPLKQDQVLVWNGFHWTPSNNSLETLSDTYLKPDPEPGSVLSWDGFHWISVPSTEINSTPIRDHVFATDSSIIVNIDNQNITARDGTFDNITTENLIGPNSLIEFKAKKVGKAHLDIYSLDDGSRDNAEPVINFYRESPDPTTRLNHVHGGFTFKGIDSLQQVSHFGYVLGTGNRIIFSVNEHGVFDDQHSMAFEERKFGVGTRHPSYTLDIQGEGVFTNYLRPGVFADATARDAAITTPIEGSMVFLQDTQKMQVYVLDTGLASGAAANTTPGWHNIY